VARRRGVDDHEAVFALRHRLGEGAEHRDLLGAGAPQVLFEQGLARRVEVFAPAVASTSSV
jgi:succinylarginine dihydrolase